MTASIITIGDEILIGQIVDTNSAWMAEQLNLKGIQVRSMVSIGDTEQEIHRVLHECMTLDKLVLMTGGLGPTKDDITKKVIAAFWGVEMAFSDETWRHLQSFMERLGRVPTEAHYQQCYMPGGATLLENAMGTAPGMWFQKGEHVLVAMPGVPYEMKSIMTQQVLPRLQQTFQTRALEHRTILTAGLGESLLAKQLADFEDSLPPHIKLAYLPNLAKVRLRLSAAGDNPAILNEQIKEKVEAVKNILGDVIYGFGNETLEQKVGDMLVERKMTLATAESCTGGYLAHLITSVPGSSAYFLGSVISYSNDVKVHQLGVTPETLEKYGAVSEQTVVEMVTGLLQKIPATIGLSISGIAGPGGGTAEKPVGTVWLALSDGKNTLTRKLTLGKSRLLNIQYASSEALNMIRKFLLTQ